MARQQTPKNLAPSVDFSYQSPTEGTARRISYHKEILEHAPIFPKPVVYSDIDKSVLEFVENQLDFEIDGKKIPTFTTFSSQRFSEYSQTWSYTDKNGNIYKNFKTISRETNPNFGSGHGQLANIPGHRNYPILIRTVMEDDGKECYECHSMKQPYSVDLVYQIHFVTNLLENVNVFNQQLQYLFQSKQYYIRPNGYWMPLLLDNINDSTSYTINDVKIYVQMATIKCQAYIIREEDFITKKYPKTVRIGDGTSYFASNKPSVDIDEYNANNIKNTAIDLNLTFPPYNDKTEFEIDTDMVVTGFNNENVRNFRIFVNDEPAFTEREFKVKNGDNIKVKVFPFLNSKESKLTLTGYNPNSVYDKNKISDFESDETPRFEEINIE